MARKSLNSSGGFTLLEVLISLTILGMAVAVVIQLFSSGSRHIMASDNYSRAVLIAEARMRDMMDKPSFSEGEWSEQTEEGCRVDCLVSDMLSERTADLPLKMLWVDLALTCPGGSRTFTIRLRSSKLVEKPVMEDDA